MEFLRNIGPYLIVGLMFFLMMRMGGGCCGGHSKHSQENQTEDKNAPKKSCH